MVKKFALLEKELRENYAGNLDRMKAKDLNKYNRYMQITNNSRSVADFVKKYFDLRLTKIAPY